MTTAALTISQTLTLPDIGPAVVTFDEQGDGRPFLVLHGGAGPQSMARISQLLAEQDHTMVLTPTHPGFGGTPRPDRLTDVSGLAVLYRELLDTLGLDDVTLVGNSIGGWIAAELALLNSPRVSRLILLDAVGIDVVEHPVADVSALSVPEIMALSFHDPAPFLLDPGTLPDAQKAIMAANAAALGVYAGTPAMADPTLLSRLGAITVPTLVLWGDSDQIVELEYGRTYASAIQGARFQILEATGHMPQMETPELVLSAIRAAGATAT